MIFGTLNKKWSSLITCPNINTVEPLGTDDLSNTDTSQPL